MSMPRPRICTFALITTGKPELLRRVQRLGNRRGIAAIGHRSTRVFEQLLALVFEEIHGG
jgi:hypothetical protein